MCHTIYDWGHISIEVGAVTINNIEIHRSIDSFLTLAVKLQNGGFLLLELQNRGFKIVGLIWSIACPYRNRGNSAGFDKQRAYLCSWEFVECSANIINRGILLLTVSVLVI